MKAWLSISLALPLLLGCGNRGSDLDVQGEDYLKKADVVLLCEVVTDNNKMTYAVLEVWRDMSKGEFEYGVGAKLPEVNRRDPDAVYAKKAIALYFKDPAMGGEYNSVKYAVYDDRVPSWRNKSVKDIRQLVDTIPYAQR
jgi:hypothetical protein